MREKRILHKLNRPDQARQIKRRNDLQNNQKFCHKSFKIVKNRRYVLSNNSGSLFPKSNLIQLFGNQNRINNMNYPVFSFDVGFHYCRTVNLNAAARIDLKHSALHGFNFFTV